MITFIQGKLVKSTPSTAVVNVGGIGYKILIPTSVFTQLPQMGKEVFLYTSYVVRELSHTLYGFLDEKERELFEAVTNVSGIGPKIGLSLIGHLPIDRLRLAISGNDVVEISKVPGIGKKTAQRLIIEMRDKLGAQQLISLPQHLSAAVTGNSDIGVVADAMSALINLGYSQSVAQKAVAKSMDTLSEKADLAMLITDALKNV